MQGFHLILARALVFTIAPLIIFGTARADTGGYAVTGRGPDYKILQKTTVEHGTNHVHRIVQLETGLNYTNSSGQLAESSDQITLLSTGGAIANQGRHTVGFPADIYNGVLTVTTPDGRILKSRPLGVSYDDGSNTVFIATLKSAQGYLTASNTVTYRDAFDGIKADLVCRYRRSGFECDLVLRQQPPTPDQYGLDGSFSTLQMVTEFFDTADPQQIPAASDDWYGLQDTTLKFGKLTMTHGKAFAFKGTNSQLSTKNSQLPSAPVYKSWIHSAGRTFLVESVPLLDIAEDLNALPLTASLTPQTPNAKPKTLLATSRTSNRAFPPSRLTDHASGPRQLLLATADLAHEPGVVLDYNEIDDGPTDFTFEEGQTYLIGNGLSFEGTTTFGHAVLKFSGDPMELASDSTVVCSSLPEDPTIFSSVNDDSVGEVIPGSSGTPSESETLFFLNILCPNTVLSNMDFLYGSYTILVTDGNIDLWNCRFLPVDIAVQAYGDDGNFLYSEDGSFGGKVGLHNVLLQEVWNDIPVYGDKGVIAENVTLDGYNWLGAATTNCLLVTDPSENEGVAFVPGAGVDVYTTDGGPSVHSATSIFQSAANANFYLASGSPYRNVGTTNVSPALLAELQTMTTYAPQDGGFPDTNGTALGYHYPVNEDSDHNGLPDWWEWHWFGNYDYSSTNVDAAGNTFLDDYNNDVDPNVIQFSIEVTNNYVRTTNVTLHLDVTAGVPYYYIVLVDDTNYLTATNWTAYTSTDIAVGLSTNEGWHQIFVCLKGLPADATTTWEYKRLKLDTLPPVITVTNAITTTTVPLVQVSGFSLETLSHISYDLTNALGLVTNLDAGITRQEFDTNNWEYTTNYFECLDVFLTNGVNTLIIHATDLAGNVTTTNASFTVNYSTATNPVVTLAWPQNGMRLSGSSFTLRGTVDDPTATIAVTLTDTNGATNITFGVVGRTGVLWVENLPLTGGTNWLTLNVTNAAGLSNTTNIYVVQSPVTVTMNDQPDATQLWEPVVNVTGTISDPTYAVWVNGIQGTNNGNGTWAATNVPVARGGVASFDVTVYPPTEAPDGSLSGAGANPRSANAADVNADPDKPVMLYTQAYRYSSDNPYNRTYDLYDNLGGDDIYGDFRYTVNHTAYHWGDESGGGGSQVWSANGTSGSYGSHTPSASGWTITQSWPVSFWPLVLDGTQSSVPLLDINSTVPPPVLINEACHINVPIQWQKPTYDVADGLSGITKWNGSYARNANATMILKTGGKGLPGHKSLFCLMAWATQQTPWLYGPYIPIPAFAGLAIPSQNITVMGKQVGSDGKLWVALDDGGQQIVTPTVSGMDYYTFGMDKQKYQPYIDASTHNLDNETPEFCVGQKVVFTLANLPADDIASMIGAWSLPANYVNESYPYSSTCTSYRVNASLLENRSVTSCWFYNKPGGHVTVSLNLQFKNGQTASVAANGNFTIYRPTFSNFSQQLYQLTWNIPYLGADMFWKVTVNSKYDGQYGITQLLLGTGVYYSTSGSYVLDGNSEIYGEIGVDGSKTYNSNDGSSQILTFQDDPSAPTTSLNLDFKDYLRFQPSGDNSIFVTIGLNGWFVNASVNPFTGTLTPANISPATRPVDSDEFPVWSTYRSSH